MRKMTKFTVVLLALLMVGGMFQPAIHAFSEVKIMSKDITEYEKANVEIFNQNDESLGTLKYEIKGKPIHLPFLRNIEILRVRAEEKTPELLNVKIMVKILNKIDEGIIKVAIMLWDNSVNEDITKETKIVFTRHKWDSNTSNENTGNNYNPIEDDNEQTEETKQKDIPLTPLTPSEPIEPEQKDIPLTPLTPSEPVEPEQKDIPLTPLTPSEPVEPEHKDIPLTPLTPSEPVEPGQKDIPLTPLTPSEPVEPEKPEEPGTETPEEPQDPGKEEPQPEELTDELLKEIIDKVSELLSKNETEKVDEYINSLKLSEEDKNKVNNLINELKEKLKNPKEEPQPEEPQDPGKKESQPEEPQDPGKEEPQDPGKEEPGDNKEQPEEPQEPGTENPGTENPGKEEPQPEEPQEPGDKEQPEEPGDDKEEPQDPGKENPVEPGTVEPGKGEPQPEQPQEPGTEEPEPSQPKEPEEKIVDDPSWDLGKRFNNGAIINKEEFRNEFLRLVNEKRAEVGVAPLKLGKHLEKGSDIRAKEMADHGSMRGGYPTEEDPENKKGKHMRPDGKESFRTAYDYLGNYDSYKGGNLGENILERYRVYPEEDVRKEWIGTSKSLAKKCFDLWAASPGHLRNIVGSQYKTTWVSVATDEVEDYKLFMIAQNVFDVCENDDPLN